MPMLKLERIALELLEYKLGDIRAEREVRGGISSVWSLYQYLVKEVAVLSPEERKQLEDMGRTLKKYRESPKKPKEDHSIFEDLVVGGLPDMPVLSGALSTSTTVDAPKPKVEVSPEVAEEQAILQRLAKRVWWSDMDQIIQSIAVSSRAEKGRYTARLLYAVCRNLELYARKPTFSGDLNLAKFTVLEAVPERADPLLSLSDFKSLSELVKEIIEVIIALGSSGSYESLDVSEDQAFGYVRRMALAIARDPYAGRMSLMESKSATSKQIRLVLQELSRETMREDERQHQKQQLELRLQEALAFERKQYQLFQEDVMNYTEAATVFFAKLERYLPARYGGQASDPRLDGGVLFAQNPALNVQSVPANTQALTVRVKGPCRFKLDGLEIALMKVGVALSLFVNDKQFALRPRLSINLGKRQLKVFQEADYVHLKLTEGHRSLASLTAEALTVFFVLSNEYYDGLLRALKTVAGLNVGEPQVMVAKAIQRLNDLTAQTPDRKKAIEGFLLGSAKASGVNVPTPVITGLAQRIHSIFTAKTHDLSRILASYGKLDVSMTQIQDDPVSVEIAGQVLTIRKYPGYGKGAKPSLVAMLPGRPIGSFSDYLLADFPNGTLLCVNSDGELVVMFSERPLQQD